MNTAVKKMSFSIRLSPVTISSLDDASNITGHSRAKLIRQYIQDGLNSLFFGPSNSIKNSYRATNEFSKAARQRNES